MIHGLGVTRLLIVGAGGHAKVVIEAVRACGVGDIVGIIDPFPPSPLVSGVPVLGDDSALPRLRREGIAGAVVALGNNAVRLSVGGRLKELDFMMPAVIHPSSFIAPSGRVTEGAVVMARAVVGTGAVIGRLAILNTAAVVDHDCDIGVAAHVAPGCALAGNVVVGERVLIGVGSSVRPGIRIGSGAVIGAGSSVVRDIPENARVAGAPARSLTERDRT